MIKDPAAVSYLQTVCFLKGFHAAQAQARSAACEGGVWSGRSIVLASTTPLGRHFGAAAAARLARKGAPPRRFRHTHGKDTNTSRKFA